MVINEQELQPTQEEIAVDTSAAGVKTSYLKSKNEAILDAIDDILEIKFLIEDIEREEERIAQDESRSTYEFKSPWCSPSTEKALKSLKAKLDRNLDTIERMARFSQEKDLEEILQAVRKDFLEMKAHLREGYKIKGALLCAQDWQSPIYAASYPLTGNRLSHKIEEHVLDYKRDGHLDSAAYEEGFITEYLSHLGSDRIRSYLTNSGMAAFSTVLHWLRDEIKVAGNALAVTPMYFENIHLAKAFFPALEELNTQTDSTPLISHLRKSQPGIIFVDAVTNCGTVLSQDLDLIMTWARVETSKPTTIVIDTTCMPASLLPEGFLKNLPEHVSVVIVESLAKHHQFGMDAVTGGIIILDGEEHLHESFKPTRARLGTNISDSSAGSLPRPNRERLERRLRRHSKNMERVGRELERQIQLHQGIFNAISWADKGQDNADWFRSPIMSVSLCPEFQSVWHYQEFENKVHELASEMNLPVAFSTSFGFDVSRLYVTAPSTDFEPPFLRFSIGTENQFQIDRLLTVISIASEQLAAGWTLRGKVVPVNIRPIKFHSTATRQEPTVTQAHNSVYSGENSLKDYLNPENYQPTPLVELPGDLNPYTEDGVRIFAKFMPLVPLMNIKSIPAFSMLSNAAARGDLDSVKNVIESSSSNTVMSLSVIAKLFGIDTTCAIVDHSLAPGLERMLRLFGIELYKHPSLGHELFGKVKPRRDRAESMGAREGWFNPNQYSNPDNPEGFAKHLAPQIWEQTRGNLDIISLGLGTCGTMVGLTSDLKQRKPDLDIIACCPAPGQAVPGPREECLLKDVTFDWQNIASARVDLEAKESFAASTKLLRRGIMGGPSSGMNYAGLLKHLESLKTEGKLSDMVKNSKDGKLSSIFLCCDSPLQHIDEYFEVLDESNFPPVHPVKEEDLH